MRVAQRKCLFKKNLLNKRPNCECLTLPRKEASRKTQIITHAYSVEDIHNVVMSLKEEENGNRTSFCPHLLLKSLRFPSTIVLSVKNFKDLEVYLSPHIGEKHQLTQIQQWFSSRTVPVNFVKLAYPKPILSMKGLLWNHNLTHG